MFGKTERHIDSKPRSGCRGCPALLPAEVAAAMTMVFLNGCTESPKIMAFSEDIAELDIKKDMNLSDVLALIGMVGSHCCFQLKFMTVLSIMLIINQCQNIAFKLYHDSKLFKWLSYKFKVFEFPVVFLVGASNMIYFEEKHFKFLPDIIL